LNGDQQLTKGKLLDFLGRLGASARNPGACFITGGGSAVLLGWRDTTIDVDLKFDPEPAGAVPRPSFDPGSSRCRPSPSWGQHHPVKPLAPVVLIHG
jgi:hypothetical protein